MTLSAPDEAAVQAAQLGLDPRGYPVRDDDLDEDDLADVPDDPTYTILEYVCDQAGAQGMDVDEFVESTRDYDDDEDDEG